MSDRKEYEITEDERESLMNCIKPIPAIMLQCGEPPSQQENANRWWADLGKKMGFKSMTIRSVPGKSDRFFTAECEE